MFYDGKEEQVNLSQIAFKIEGRIRNWEGIRVCALYEPRFDWHL